MPQPCFLGEVWASWLQNLAGGPAELVDRDDRKAARNRDLPGDEGRRPTSDEEHRVNLVRLGQRAIEGRLPILPGKQLVFEDGAMGLLLRECHLVALRLGIADLDRPRARSQSGDIARDDMWLERLLVRKIDHQAKAGLGELRPDIASRLLGGLQLLLLEVPEPANGRNEGHGVFRHRLLPGRLRPAGRSPFPRRLQIVRRP